MHSAYAGAGGGGILVVCSLLSVSGSYRLYMIGVHVALLLQLLFIFVFALQVPPADQHGTIPSTLVCMSLPHVFAQAYKSYGVPEKQDRFPLFVAMGVGSVVALGLMKVFKPKKKRA